jgi:cell division protein FtsW
MLKFFSNLKGDKVIWVVVIILSIFSVLAVYSSTGTLAYKQRSGNTEYYLIKHTLILFLGFSLMYLSHLVRYTLYSRISQLALFIAIPLLFFTLVTGTNLNEASRWLTLPVININFQTSDFAKLALIIYVARMLSKKQDEIKDFKSAFLPIIFPVVLVCMLIFPANLSTAAILFLTAVILMFIGRINLKYIAYMALIGGFVVGIFILFLMNSPNKGRLGTWKSRIESFAGGPEHKDPDKEYQINQSKIAIASGGLIGKFPGNSTQRNFLPHAYSDFIFAIIIEEYGLFGGIFIILLYLILLYRGIRIATKCEKTFGSLLCIGMSFILVFQAFIHFAIITNLFPVTGQPLPLISMGGTSIWFTSIAIGIMLSVSRETEKQNEFSDAEQPLEPIGENTQKTEYAAG